MSSPYERLHEQAAEDPRVSQDTYALIHPQGTLTFETGSVYSIGKVVDPHHGAESGFTIEMPYRGRPGLRGYGADVALLFPEKYAPNPLAERLIPRLGGPVQQWRGNVAIFGYQEFGDIGELDTCGLTPEWQDYIRHLAYDQEPEQ